MPAGATAAAATSKHRTTTTTANANADAAKRRAALQRQRERRRVRAAAVFDKYQDGLSGTMERAKLGAFLQDVMKLDTTVDVKVVKVVQDAAAAAGKTKEGGNLKKSAVLDAVEHYGEYVKHAAQVDALYAQFDSDGNNELGREEFQKALEQHEARQTERAAVPVTAADLDVILERADADQDGQISRAEILPALAAWEEMAAIKAEEAQEAACCVVL